MKSMQSPVAVIMIRPHAFRVNPETAADNTFQQGSAATLDSAIAEAARFEFDKVVETLQAAGVVVHVFDDFGERDTPDSLFPNNWISAGPDGRLCLYPMYTPNRRRERRDDVVAFLKSTYDVTDLVDLSANEEEGRILEGTGSLVLDYVARVAYAARSQRTNGALFEEWCAQFGFRPVLFDAVDAHGAAIYHTNVVMGIGSTLAMVGADCIRDSAERARVLDSLRISGHDVVELSQDQIANFAGNCLELAGRDGPVLAISARAVGVLTADQLKTIAAHVRILPLTIPTIELAGGSVRCLMADVHLSAKPK